MLAKVLSGATVGLAARRNEVLKQISIVITTWGKWELEHLQPRVTSPPGIVSPH